MKEKKRLKTYRLQLDAAYDKFLTDLVKNYGVNLGTACFQALTLFTNGERAVFLLPPRLPEEKRISVKRKYVRDIAVEDVPENRRILSLLDSFDRTSMDRNAFLKNLLILYFGSCVTEKSFSGRQGYENAQMYFSSFFGNGETVRHIKVPLLTDPPASGLLTDPDWMDYLAEEEPEVYKRVVNAARAYREKKDALTRGKPSGRKKKNTEGSVIERTTGKTDRTVRTGTPAGSFSGTDTEPGNAPENTEINRTESEIMNELFSTY